jgi:lysozyme
MTARACPARSPSLLAAAAFALLGGCGAMEGNYPLKGDNRPHPGVAAAHRYAVHGIDISRWQGEIDWAAVKGAGTRFVYMKATEGGDHVDPAFQRNWEGGAPRRRASRRLSFRLLVPPGP